MGVPLIVLVWALPASHETMPLGNTACELENKINEMNKYSMLCTYKQNKNIGRLGNQRNKGAYIPVNSILLYYILYF